MGTLAKLMLVGDAPMSSRKIDQVDQHLREWIASTFPGVSISLDLPSVKPGGPAVGLYLYELSVAPPLRTQKRPPLQLSLRYLVTASGSHAEAGHQMLEEFEHPIQKPVVRRLPSRSHIYQGCEGTFSV